MSSTIYHPLWGVSLTRPLVLLFVLNVAFVANALPEAFNNGRFYYQSLENDGDIYISRSFRLAYATATTNVTWSMPPSCSYTSATKISEPTNSQLSVTCKSSGSQKFEVYRDGDIGTTDTFYINVQPSQGCYWWYWVTAGTNTSTIQPSATLHASPQKTAGLVGLIWIIDPQTASPQELSRNATIPSRVSSQITSMLYHAGEAPAFKFTSKDTLEISSIQFNTSLK
ncbi:hypothetical protein BKA69DRAFT_661734 [Paraphysoderma sedebokerense]|nr:hypothetical protein BKA69DRAFT_661734 [Paraphysoderma sedebokerense]